MLSSHARARQYGALLLLALSFPATLMAGACSSAEAGAFGPSSSSGGGDSGSSFDTSVPETSLADTAVAQDGPTLAPTTALLVQASPSLPDVRLCWATNGVVAPVVPFPGDGVMPGSNYPGVPLGGVAAMSDATSLVGDGITLYALDAENLARIEQGQTAPQSTCDLLVCGSASNQPPPCLRYNLDYWPVATIAAGTGVVTARDNVVALSGCLPGALDPNASTTLCGPSWSASSGNLHADVLQLSPSSTTTGSLLSLQAAQLSPALAALEGDGGTALVSFGADDADAAIPVAILHGEGDLAAPTGVPLDAGLVGYGQLGFTVDVPGAGGAGQLWMSLAESQQLIDPTVDPTLFFGQPRTYLVAVLGDPNAPHAFAPVTGDAGYDGKGLHVLVVAAPLPEAGVTDAGTGDP
ncbi:MAG TPA: hypothetical protein VGL81_28610 [Polyangiaceae bacterium]|jgi:hypothetical protein